MIEMLKDQGHQVFLDLKCHDIPNTIFYTMKQLKQYDVDMVNVHAAGGKTMMEAARKALGSSTRLIAVTQLTSMSEDNLKEEQLLNCDMTTSVLNYARISKEAGLDGVISSAWEAFEIHETIGDDFICVCPGIRLEKDHKGDQKRTMTPIEAKENGADYIVVGRSITKSNDPYKTYQEIKRMWYDV